MKKLITARHLAITIGLIMAVMSTMGIRVVADGTPFNFNWNGTPTTPQSVVSTGWDTQIHVRGSSDNMQVSNVQHGADCSAPPATHVVQTLADSQFICNNHLMTGIVDAGYGEISLTPNHLVDFSGGTSTISVHISTQQQNLRDWVEVWITPFADNQTLPFEASDPDMQGPPKNSLVFSFNSSGLFGTHEGDVSRFDNFIQTHLPRANGTTLASLGLSSATVRTPYQIDISQSHIRFGLPGSNVWWTDTNISPLPYTQAVVSLTHHSYDPCKGQTISVSNPCNADTWHWSDFAISNAVPFTILNGNLRSIHQGTNATVDFGAPAPSNSFLRFSGIGTQGSTYTVSYDGGVTWISPALQSKVGTHDEHFSSYWTSIPQGTQTVMFRGKNWWGGPWWIRDPAIWSLSSSTAPTPSPSPSPVISPSPSPSPTPVPITNAPCTVTMPDNTIHTGICSGTFIG